MNPCKNQGCRSILTDLYTDNGWIRICPVCKNVEKLPLEYKHPTEADIGAGFAYVKAQKMDYADAEERFLSSYYASTDADLKAGYLWWAVKCCFGVEYVREILYENDRERRTCQYTPIFARIPLNTKVDAECKTLCEFEQYLHNHPQEGMSVLYADIRNLYTETAGVLRSEKNHYDVFIAWHDKEGSTQCQKFAKELKNWLNEKRVYSFASFSALQGKEIWHFEPYIYAAMATARVFVIVIDDYQALGEKFLKWEIKRMGARKNQDQKIVILFNGMKEHTGQIPVGLMDGWQRHYEDSEVTPDRVSLVGRDVLDALSEKKPHVSAPSPILPSAIAVNKMGNKLAGKRGKKEEKEPGLVALAVPDGYIPKNYKSNTQSAISDRVFSYYKKAFRGIPMTQDSCLLLGFALILCAIFGFIGLPYPFLRFPKLLFAFLIIGTLLLMFIGIIDCVENKACVVMDLVLLTLASVFMMRGILDTAGTFWTANYLIFGICSAVLMLCMLYCDSSLCKKRIRRILTGYVKSQEIEASYVFGVDIVNGYSYKSTGGFTTKDCISYFKYAAGNGVIDAMYALAGCYANGCYVERDEEQATNYLYQMMIAGDERGAKLLGEYCFNNAENEVFWKKEKKLFDWAKKEVENESLGARQIIDAYYQYVEQNAANAEFWEEKAELIDWAFKEAAEDNADAQYVLGVYYQYAKQELDTAMRFYSQAVQQGQQKARAAIGNIYYQAAEAYRTGQDTRIDLEQAIVYYREAISWGHKKKGAEGLFSVGKMYLDRTDEAIRSVDKAHLCFTRAWNEGDYKGIPDEWYRLGLCYFYGDGVSIDLERAVRCFDIAAEAGSAEAQFMLGKCYLEGIGTNIDRKQAVGMFKKVHNNSEASYYLGLCYENGWGTSKNYKKALEEYKKAAKLGSSAAAYVASQICFSGIYQQYSVGGKARIGKTRDYDYPVIEPDVDEGLKYLSQAAMAGILDAQVKLGQLYADGRYVAPDIQTAKKWFMLATEQGNAEAQRWLEKIEKQS